jgi:hypothetical protein
VSSPHSAQHQQLLEELLSSADAMQAVQQSELAGCASCEEVLREHLAVLRQLDALGSAEREGMGAALAAVPRQDGAAEARLREELRSGRPPRPTARRIPLPLLWMASAAALVLALFFLQDSGSETTPVDPATLLGPAVGLLHPSGVVDHYAPFRWQAERPEAGWFRLAVFAADQPNDADPLWESGKLYEMQCTPGDSTLRTR